MNEEMNLEKISVSEPEAGPTRAGKEGPDAPDHKEIRSFCGANFTGSLGEAFRFCTLDEVGRPCGRLLTGKVQSIRRKGRKTVVDMYLFATGDLRPYPAEKIYFHGRPRKGLL